MATPRTLRELTTLDVVEAFADSAEFVLFLRLTSLMDAPEMGALRDPQQRRVAILRGPTAKGLRALADYARLGEGTFEALSFVRLQQNVMGAMPDQRLEPHHPVALAFMAACARHDILGGHTPSPIQLGTLASASVQTVRVLVRAGKLRLTDNAQVRAYCADRRVPGFEATS